MSWAEVSKINSNFHTPLNVQRYIYQLQLLGSSVAVTDEDLPDLIHAESLYTNPVALEVVGKTFFSRLLDTNHVSNQGSLIAKCFSIPAASSITKWSDCLANTTVATALANDNHFFKLLRPTKDAYVDEIFDSSYLLLNKARQSFIIDCLYEDVDWINTSRTHLNMLMPLINNGEFFAARQTHTYNVTKDEVALVFAVGMGENGNTSTSSGNSYVNRSGGDGGAAKQVFKRMSIGDAITTTISTSGTVCDYFDINLGIGGGASGGGGKKSSGNSHHGVAPNVDGLIIPASSPSLYAAYSSDGDSYTAGGAGAGFGGGNGGPGKGHKASGGGAGINVLPAVDGTGGYSVTTRDATLFSQGTAGGGSGGVQSYTYSACSGGGGGYGGGGGANSSGGTAPTGLQNDVCGQGGSGCLLIIH